MNYWTSRGAVKWAAGLLLCLAPALASRAAADQIVLNNGDRITGTIDSADAGKLTILSPIAGKITVDFANIKTFSTDAPIKIVLADGSILNERVSEGSAGNIETATGGLLAVQSVSLSNVEKINPPPVAWTGSIAISGSLTQGDTDSEQLGATLGLSRRGENDRFLVDAQYLFGKQKINGVTSTTNDQWFIQPAYNYFFTKRFYVNASVRVEKNRIQNLDIRVTPGLGLGYQIVERPDFNANVEGGLAWVYEDYTNIGKPSENVSLRLAYHVDKTLWDSKLKVFSDCTYFPSIQNVSNYLVLFDAGLRLALTKTMFSELRGEADYDSHPAPGAHRTDTQLILGVGWTF